MKTLIINPTLKNEAQYIREGRCMQKASSWATAWPPISLALLGTLAQKYGDVRLWDGNVEPLTLDELLAAVENFKADVVVVNSGFPSIEQDMAVAKAIKDRWAGKKVISFGVYFTMLEKEGFLHYPFLDAVMVGEPEETFMELLDSWARGAQNLRNVRGLIYKDGRQVIMTAPRPLLEDLDALPMPDRRLLKNELYRLPHNNKVYTLINSARGCPYDCIYCIVKTYYGAKLRKHSIGYVIREIRHCLETFGIRDFLFWEEAFTLDKRYVLQLCAAMAEQGLTISWAATTRVGSLTEDVAAAMKKAGCYLIGLGIESSSQDILDQAKKKQTIADIERAVAICKKYKIQTMGHFIFGLPGETRATAEQTLKFMRRLGIDYMQCYCAVPYPKTELGDLAKAKDWICAQRWSQYDFGGDSIMNTDHLSHEEVDAFRRRAFFGFYFRPWYVLRKIFTDLSLRQLFKLSTFTDWMKLAGLGRKRPR
ncbi:radical SAM protein [candidate division FCPU426 bacterium]|nr:radical SAM protein [candidate division FCPU426 bacterium]